MTFIYLLVWRRRWEWSFENWHWTVHLAWRPSPCAIFPLVTFVSMTTQISAEEVFQWKWSCFHIIGVDMQFIFVFFFHIMCCVPWCTGEDHKFYCKRYLFKSSCDKKKKNLSCWSAYSDKVSVLFLIRLCRCGCLKDQSLRIHTRTCSV